LCVDIVDADISRPALFPSCDDGSATARDDNLKKLFQFLVRDFEVKPLGKVRVYPATSCQEVQEAHFPSHQSGEYWITSPGEEPTESYCDF